MSERDPFDHAVEALREATDAPLSDGRLRATYERMRPMLHPRRRWAWLGLGAVFATTVAATILIWPQSVVEPPVATRLVLAAGEIAGAPEPGALEQPTTYRLEAGARAHLTTGRARVVVLGPAVAHLDRRTRIESGTVLFAVTPGERPFVVGAGDAEVTVLGTRFGVVVTDGRLTNAEVSEGEIEIRRGSEITRLDAGHSLTDDAELPLSDLEGPLWVEDRLRGRLFIDSEPAAAEVFLDDAWAGLSPIRLERATGEVRVTVRHRGRKPWSDTVIVSPKEITRVRAQLDKKLAKRRPDPAIDELWERASRFLKTRRCKKLDRHIDTILETSAGHEAEARALMLGAECRVRTGKKRKALQLFRRVEEKYGSTASAEAALFERAKLESDLGNRASALDGFESYLGRFPKGRLRDPATFRRCELLIGKKDMARARTCLEGYAERFGRGARIRDVQLLLATIARVEERWRDAAGYYRAYLRGAPPSERSAKARYELILCLRRGNLPGADEAVAEYLRLHPDGAHADALR